MTARFHLHGLVLRRSAVLMASHDVPIPVVVLPPHNPLWSVMVVMRLPVQHGPIMHSSRAMIGAVTNPKLLADEALEASSVVANNAMNRERGLRGVNSYAKDLGFDPLAWLAGRIGGFGKASWLDLCCGTGRALIQASRLRLPHLDITGVDLAGYFDEHDNLPALTLITGSLALWRPEKQFELITCVHGLHYVGDKLGTLATTLSWLSPGGFFAAHLDLNNIKVGGVTDIPTVRKLLRANGIDYNPRRRLVTCGGLARLEVPYAYLGADDRAGPNYTGQPVVDSHYR